MVVSFLNMLLQSSCLQPAVVYVEAILEHKAFGQHSFSTVVNAALHRSRKTFVAASLYWLMHDQVVSHYVTGTGDFLWMEGLRGR